MNKQRHLTKVLSKSPLQINLTTTRTIAKAETITECENKEFIMKKVFMVEDNATLVANVSEILADSYEVMSADLAQGMEHVLNQIKDFEPDVVLLDHYLETSFYGSDLRRNISGIRIVSISTEKQDYCDEHWGKKMTFFRRRYMSTQVIEELKEVIDR